MPALWQEVEDVEQYGMGFWVYESIAVSLHGGVAQGILLRHSSERSV